MGMIPGKNVTTAILFIMILIPMSAFSAEKQQSSPILIGDFSHNTLTGWKEKKFSGNTRYQLVQQEDRIVLQAEADASASGLFKEITVDLTTHPYLNWEWKIDKPHPMLAERTKAGDDYAARIYVVVKGGLMFWKTRAINYVWASKEEKGSVWPNAFVGKNAMLLAVRSAADKPEFWYQEKCNVYEDLKEIFGEEIKTIHAVAIMTDSDNSKGSVAASYGDISFTAD
jgi:hypothetical protein